MKRLIPLISMLLWTLQARTASPADTLTFSVLGYNVENLYDTQDDPLTLDDEFTPSSEKKWDKEKYEKKVHDIATVLSTAIPGSLPDVMGLAEVENRKVIEDLVSEKSLTKGKYAIVHKDSPDEGGIDVAFLYKPASFTLKSFKAIPVHFPFDTITTRDILYVSGTTQGNELLHFFVNHWPTRGEGQAATERRRQYAAVLLRKAVDSIFNYEPEAKIIIMGDFNDEPTNLSLHGILNANNKRKNASPRELYNLMYDMHNIGNLGTYNYKGGWTMLDQLIVSQPLLHSEKGWKVTWEGGKIFRADWMMVNIAKVDGPIPDRTYSGPNYTGGVSDHLPVFMILKKPGQ
jgi:predicted extracellular nuclease